MTNVSTTLSERQAWVAAIILLALYGVLRTLGATDDLLRGWTLATMLATLLAPVAGLLVLAALGPFSEAQTADGAITFVPQVIACLGFAVAARLLWARDRWPRWRRSWPLLAGVALACITLAGVGLSALNFGRESGLAAAQSWVPGIGGALTVLMAAVWASAAGQSKALAVAVGSVAVAALLAVIDFSTRGTIIDSPIGWLLRDHDPARLGEIIPAPNAAASIFLAAAAVTLGAAVFERQRRLRATAAIATAVLVIATVFTYSRSALLAGAVVAFLIGTRWWSQQDDRVRRLGLLIAAAATLVFLGAAFWELSPLRDVPEVADEARLVAWGAAFQMWLDAPVIGHGFRSFEWLHEAYGSVLDAPHNEWLRFFAEGGIVCGAAGIVFIGSTMTVLLRGRDWLTYACGVTATSILIMATFNNPFLYVQANVPIFLIMGAGIGLAIVRAEERVPVTSGPES